MDEAMAQGYASWKLKNTTQDWSPGYVRQDKPSGKEWHNCSPYQTHKRTCPSLAKEEGQKH